MLKYTAPLAICYNRPLVHNKPLGAPAFVRLVYYIELDWTEQTCVTNPTIPK